MMRAEKTRHGVSLLTLAVCASFAGSSRADPCGMVPPIEITGVTPIERIGLQKTYVFFRDGVETFVIRPGYRGRVDNFGMLIPFPKPPEIRKVPDDIFSHIAAAVDPPEVVVNLLPRVRTLARAFAGAPAGVEKRLEFDAVRVLRQEAVGMYEVAVLEAGSASALERWMDDHGYRYPEGMDDACNDYVAEGWCFVAVKTRVGNKAAVDPRAGQKDVDPTLPEGATFDGNVQAMGFRFRVDELVVPMRLSAFNEGELRNVVYILTEGPRRIDSIPEEYVVRQIEGEELYENLTRPLPVRVLGGTWDDIPEARKKRLAEERDPKPHSGHARELFASDLLAVELGRLSHPFEEDEKELLRISERLGLRGAEIDRLHHEALEEKKKQVLEGALEEVRKMTLTVVDGDFPRDLLARENLTFSPFTMPAAKNDPASYDAKLFGPAKEREGNLYERTGSIGGWPAGPAGWIVLLAALAIGGAVAILRRRRATPPRPSPALRRVAHRLGRGPSCVLVALSTIAILSMGAGDRKETRAGATDVHRWIAQLDDRDRSQAAVEKLVAAGDRAVGPLFAEALDGTVLERRGWAIVCLSEIGGEKVDRRLVAVQEDTRQPKLVRTWAAAARVALASSAAELIEHARSIPELPALGRPIAKRLTALLARGEPVSAEDLIELSLQVTELREALAAPILATGAKKLVEVMTRSGDQNVRRQAAAYLGTLAGQGDERVAQAVIEAYRFDPEAKAVPWKGGPLFVPGIQWKPEDARSLARELLSWLVFSDRNELAAEKRQIHNNLRSLQLAAAAGYKSPGFREQGVLEWLRAWRDAFGADAVRKVLAEQGVDDDPKYAPALEE